MAFNTTISEHDDFDLVSGVAMATYNISGINEVQARKPGLQELEADVERVTEFYIKPIIYGIGIPGNILALFLWVQPRLWNSSGCYFAALSISDTFVLILHMLDTLEKAGQTNLLVTALLCEMFNVFYVSSECLSLMLVLGLTVDRFIIVCFPMKRHHFCTIHRTLKIVAGQTVLALIMGVVEGSFWTYSQSHHRCEPTNITSRRAFMEMGNIMILTFGVILPVILVIIFNVIIIINIKKANKQRRRLSHMAPTSTVDIDATMVLLSISCYVILAEVPDEVAYLIRPFYPEGNSTIPVEHREADPTWRSYYTFNITSCILSIFSMTNYAVDIFIYSLTGRRFREMVLLLLSCKIFQKKGWRRFRQRETLVWTSRASGHAQCDGLHLNKASSPSVENDKSGKTKEPIHVHEAAAADNSEVVECHGASETFV